MVQTWGKGVERERERGGGRVIGEYLVGKQIGSGSFSLVYHARHRVHGTEVAIKEISMSRLNKKLQESLMSEIFILKKINHPNIIRLHDVIEVPSKIHLVLEYCNGGDLSMHIQRHGRVTEPTAKQLMQQLAAGLKVLRDNDIIHRDLKPQNLLLSTNEGNSILKIADFGFARSLEPRGLAETLCGSPLYMAPEIMQLQKYGAKADLWSVGVILYQLVTGKTPFTGGNQIQLLQNILKATELSFPPDIEDVSSDFVDLCQKLLRRNPVERLMFDEFFNHPFLRQNQLNETFGGHTSFRKEGSFSPECNLLKTKEESCSDDGLPFLLDDDSSGPKSPNGSPFWKRSFTKSTNGLVSLESRKVANSNMRHVDHISNEGTEVQKLLSGSRIDSQRSSHRNFDNPAIFSDQRMLNSHSKALDHLDFNDQDYVIVSGPLSDISSSSTKPKSNLPSTISEHTFPLFSSIESKPSAPLPIIGHSVRYPGGIGSFDSQPSAIPGASPGSVDISDSLDQPSSDTVTRLKSLQECAANVKELVYEMVEAGRFLEAFSIQLVILAVLKQAVHICHTQAISSIDGCLSLDGAMSKISISKIKNGSDFRESLHVSCSQGLENISNVIKRDFFSEVEHAEELSKLVGLGSVELPDAMETIYQSALSLGRNGAVDELMGDIESATASYSRAIRLLTFLLVEAPSLILNPPFNLTNSDRFRLRNYINILNDRQEISRSQRLALLKKDVEHCLP